MEKPKNLRNNEAEKRWFSTGFMSGGVTSVDADKHTLSGAIVIRPGEALGHGVWIDKEFCQAVAAMSAIGKSAQAGLKARFGHPNMCSDALGTFLGRWKNITVDEFGFVRGDLHLSSTASESPKGDLRKYVEELAAKEPDHFGASIVFSRDEEAENAFMRENLHPESSMGDSKGQQFKSPDPANVKNLPHARIAELHAADLVDDPAATDGMFSGAGGTALAANMTEWLDTHPEVFAALKEPGVIDVLHRYSAELQPFIARYTANTGADIAPAQDLKPEPAAAEPAPAVNPEADAAEPATVTEAAQVPDARVEELSGQIAQLTVERDGAVQRAESVEALHTTLNADREQLAARITALEQEKNDLVTERDALKARFAAMEAGQPPASFTPAETHASRGSMWDDARKSKK